MNIKFKFLAFISILAFVGCVPTKQFKAVESKNKELMSENDKLKTDNQKLNTSLTELNSKLERLEKAAKTFENDTTEKGIKYRDLFSKYQDQAENLKELMTKSEAIQSQSTEENKKLIAKLQSNLAELQQKEDQLKKLEGTLNEKDQQLQMREQKVKELQSVLNKKDSAVASIKNLVSKALLGFKDKGLTVEQKNGKVYVSLEERLLFASGSTIVDKKGEEALKQLAQVLEANPDINILIEGHTDDVPFTTGGAIKDNWDLSVMRATSIVRILTSTSKIDPTRLTAAGRGEFLPLDPAKTPEARRKNRRTEIILTPKLDELFKVLEN